MPRGRPSKLTPERQQKLAEIIAAGNYYVTACRAVGVSYGNFREWMKRGEAEEDGKYRNFYDAMTRAEAEAEARAVALWQKAMPEDWRSVQMYLERRYPDRWGKQEKLKADVQATVSWVDIVKQAQASDHADE